MTEVLTLSSPPLANVQPLHQKIRSRSRWIVALLSALVTVFVALNIGIATTILAFPSQVGLGPRGGELFLPSEPAPTYPGFVLLSTFSFADRLLVLAGILLIAAPALMVLLNLRGLFQLYARCIVFSQENARRMKNIGIWLMTYAFAPFVTHHVGNLLLSVTNPDTRWYHSDELYALVLGILLLVIAQVMEVGHEIERDQEQFV